MLVRIITALILAAIFIALILFLPGSLFAEFTMLVMIGSLFEWDNLTTRSNIGYGISALTVVLLGVVVYLLTLGMIPNSLPNPLAMLSIAGTIFWLWQTTTLRTGLYFRRTPGAEMICGILAVFFCWSGLVLLRQSEPNGILLVLTAITVISAVDIFALFTGITIGRHKLAPTISPGKTREGAAGGLIGAMLIAWLGGRFVLGFEGSQMTAWLTAALIASLISMAGDLYVSRLKRHAGVKDSGRLLPGHGGVLDRLDAMIAAMPVFAAVWWLLT